MASKLKTHNHHRDTALSRLEQTLKLHNQGKLNPEVLPLFRAYAAEVNEFYRDFQLHHNELIKLLQDEADYETEDQLRKKADAYYFQIKSALVQLEADDISSNSPAPQANVMESPIMLQRIEVPPFSGSLKEWPTFIELFTNLVDKNPRVSDTEKFYYLITLLKGEPLLLVRTLPLIGSNYKIAIDNLRARYDCKRSLATLYYTELVNASVMQKGSPEELRKLMCIFKENVAALKNMKMPTDSWCFVLLNMVLSKLDSKTRASFETKFSDIEMPSYCQLMDFLENHCKAAEALHLGSTATNKIQSTSTAKPNFNVNKRTTLVAQLNTDDNSPSNPCILCSAAHQLYRCSAFLSKSVDDRINIVRQNRICYNCLSNSHFSRNCKSKMNCRTCKRFHHSLLHRQQSLNVPAVQVSSEPASSSREVNDNTGSTPQIENNASPSLVVCSSAILNNSTTVLLSTAELEVRNNHGNFVKARALLDSGSQSSFMSRDCAKRLGLKAKQVSIPIEGLNDMTFSNTQGTVKVLIKPVNKATPTFELDAIVLPRICSDQPKAHFDLAKFRHLHKINLADSRSNIPAPIDILIGAELMPYIFGTHRIFGDKGEPVAIETIFGYVLQGKLTTLSAPLAVNSFHASIEPIEECLKQFWEVESVETASSTAIMSPDEQKCEEIFDASISRNTSGRFSVKLPFCTKPQLGNSYHSAIRRFQQLENRLMNQPQIQSEYSKFLKEYLDLGHMSPIPQEDWQSHTAYYLPHHCIQKLGSTTTRYRVVFDASARTSNGKSLNDQLLIGRKLQKDIFEILTSFRTHSFVFTCDIKQMFRQILVSEEHRDYQRILWRFDQNEPIQEYRLNTVTFGMCSSPYLAQRTLIHLANVEEGRFPRAANVVRNNVYVDDIAAGCDDLASVIELRDELTELLLSGGFELRKWASNRAEVLQNLPSLSQAPVSFDILEPSFIKVLGLQWNPSRDTFSYAFHSISRVCTKRAILSEVARIYDPLGFLTPIVLFAKHLLQQLWTIKSDWDASPPQRIQDIWLKFHGELSALSVLQIPRYLFSPHSTRVELHGFCDASQIGYSAVVYIRIEHSNGVFSTRLCAAKSKVAPIRTVSLPRLELLGAALLASLIRKILESSRNALDSIITWCDSEIVLYWLAAHASRWKTFVSNRVSQIQETLPHPHWHYVPTNDNPADCASRGLFPAQLSEHPLWWHGPSWLVQSPEHWPLQPTMIASPNSSLSEEKISSHLVVEGEIHPLQGLLDRFSSLSKIQRIVAYVLRFGTRKGRARRSHSLLPSQIELQDALLSLVSFVQHSCFEDTIDNLKKKVLVIKPLRKLNVFLDSTGEVIRVGGRLKHSNLAFEVKHPILLPGDNPLTQLIIDQVHRRYLHPGLKTLSYLLLQQYWILSSRKAINRCIAKCYRCFKANPKVLTPPMGDLPSYRVNQLRAFQTVCLDFAGPFLVTMSKARGIKCTKAYVCIFVCCSVKAIHLELVSDLTSEAFLAAFNRFISRRGACYDIHSDQGTNFVGAHNMLQRLAAEAGTSSGIRWHFNPPSAPHFNGLAEAGVKSIKTHLSRVVGEQVLTYEEFYTLLTKVEAILNSRPLSPTSPDPNDLLPLTPAHFLILEPLNSSVPEPNLQHLPINRLDRWQLISKMYSHFWDRWHLEYLHTLQQRSKWHRPVENIELNTLVLVKNENHPPNKWPLARVVKVHPGPDGVVRTVTLRNANGLFQRPVIKLCPLPN